MAQKYRVKWSGMLRDVLWVELRVHEREWWGRSQKGIINYPVISALEWKARSKGAFPIAMRGHQSLNKIVPFLTELTCQGRSRTSTDT